MTHVPIDPYVIDILMADLVGHDRKPSAFIVYLYLLARVQRARKDRVTASLQDLATHTGLSKSSVQSALRHLQRRQLVDRPPGTPAAASVRRVLRPWLHPTRR